LVLCELDLIQLTIQSRYFLQRSVRIALFLKSFKVLFVSVHANSFVREAYCDCAGFLIRNMAPIKIQLFGHSYVHRLKRFIASSPDYRYDFGLKQQVMVQYTGFQGATVVKLSKQLEYVQDFEPEIVFLLIGTNDLLSPDVSPERLTTDVISLVEALFLNGVHYVIVGQILHRTKTSETRFPVDLSWFNDRVNTTNHLLSDELSNRFPTRARLWRLKGFWEESAKQSALGEGDGVHLTDTGNHKLFHNIKAALVSTLNSTF